MSRVPKLVLTWGMVIALVFVLSVSVTSPVLSARDNSGPILPPDPDTEVPGDNDGIGGYKYNFRDEGDDLGDYLGSAGAIDGQYGFVASSSVPVCSIWLAFLLNFKTWLR